MGQPLRLVNSYTYKDLLLAYYECRRRKRSTTSAIKYEVNYEFNLMQLLDDINSGAYQIGKTRAFVVTQPKAREVWAADFRDRIVQHLVCRDIVPYFNDKLIEDTYSCIKGRGTLAAVQRVAQLARRFTQNWCKSAWFLQIDIANFFVSISRDILWDILKSHIGDDTLTAKLVKQIVYHNPTHNPDISPNTNFALVPAYKSLWHCEAGHGLAIGNETSQIFSNIYLNDMDHFVKHILKCKGYVRYVDDAILLSHNKDDLPFWFEAIDDCIRCTRGLHLHKHKVRIDSLYKGLVFVGGIIKPYHTEPRRLTFGSVYKAVYKFKSNMFDKHYLAVINSYLGLLRHLDTFRFRKKICDAVCLPGVVGCDPECTKIFYL